MCFQQLGTWLTTLYLLRLQSLSLELSMPMSMTKRTPSNFQIFLFQRLLFSYLQDTFLDVDTWNCLTSTIIHMIIPSSRMILQCPLVPHLCIISAALSWPFFLASQPGPHERSFESLAPSTWYFLKHAHHYPSPVWISTLFLMVAPEPYHINHTALQVVLTFMVFTAAWLSPSPLNLLISSGLPSLSFPTMAFPKHRTQDSSHLTLSPCPQTLRK